MRRAPPGRDPERGAGTVLAIACGGALVSVLLVVAPVALLFVARAQVATAADAAALAAADTASGLHPGVPCDLAATVAAANGASLVACDLDGLVATVTVGRVTLGLEVTARATAGPPPGASD